MILLLLVCKVVDNVSVEFCQDRDFGFNDLIPVVFEIDGKGIDLGVEHFESFDECSEL